MVLSSFNAPREAHGNGHVPKTNQLSTVSLRLGCYEEDL